MPDLDTSADMPATPPGMGRKGWAGVAGAVVSGLLLFGLYRTIDIRQVGVALLRADRLWLLVSVGMIVPITLLRALRFFWIAPAGALPGRFEALRLTLIASALNVVLPAKSGDLIKSYFVAKRSDTPAGVAVSMIVYERFCDLFGLTAWCLIGWAVGRPQVDGVPSIFWLLLAALGVMSSLLISSERAAFALRRLVAAVLPEGRLRKVHRLADGWPALLQALRGRRRWIVSFSLGLWLVHLTQIWMFTVALSMRVPFTVSASLSAMALMAGQLPFTFAGLGTRDVALVVLLAAYTTPESAAAMGVLIATRGLLPPLFGIPLMRPYMATAVADAQRWRRESEAAG
jgi:glycosyltransferase 2 family protein